MLFEQAKIVQSKRFIRNVTARNQLPTVYLVAEPGERPIQKSSHLSVLFLVFFRIPLYRSHDLDCRRRVVIFIVVNEIHKPLTE